MKPRKVIRRDVIYVQKCSLCGEDVKVSKDSTEPVTCYDCDVKSAYERALSEGQFLIGAEIVGFELMSEDIDELSSLKVRTKDGKVIEFTAGGWDERYIEWEEIKESEE